MASLDGAGQGAGTGRHAEPFFDHWLTLAHRAGEPHPLVRQALAAIEAGENRIRRRQAAALRTHHDLVGIIMANLVRAVLTVEWPHSVPIALAKPRQAATRYDRRCLALLPETMGALGEAGLLKITKSAVDGRASTCWPSAALIEAVMVRADLADVCRDDGEERIILSRTIRDEKNNVERRVRIDYHDTPETIRFREELSIINAQLEQADLAFLGNEPGVNTYQRRLRRIFNLPVGFPEDQPRFDMGGRLFDGWWETLPKHQRRHIRIDGEPVVELDFASMFVRLAYTHQGKEAPAGDLYRKLQRVETEEHRAAVKAVVNALLFRTGPATRLPRDSKAGLPLGLRSMEAFKAAFLAAHPALASAIERGLGFRLMRTESDIMVRVLLDLAAEGVTALPIHDGLLVAASRAGRAREVMQEVSRAVTGWGLPMRDVTR